MERRQFRLAEDFKHVYYYFDLVLARDLHFNYSDKQHNNAVKSVKSRTKILTYKALISYEYKTIG